VSVLPPVQPTPTTLAAHLPGTPGTNATHGARRIAAAFEAAHADGRAAFIPYVVAGYPDADASLAAALAAARVGADIIEIGLPYSDPLADGTTLQRAAAAALRAGTNYARSLQLVTQLHGREPSLPIVAMGYTNQVLGTDQGRERLRALASAGASGIILADLTPDEGEPLERAATDAGLALVYLVTPTTAPKRAAQIAARSGGFLYAVALVGVTGARSSLADDLRPFLRQVKSISPVQVAVGFGISRAEHARRLSGLADGVIVASALVDALGPDGRDIPAMERLARSLREATRRPAHEARSRPSSRPHPRG
jgi:tryptophan synthase alpha chain